MTLELVPDLKLEPLLHQLKIRTMEQTVIPLELKWAQRALVAEVEKAAREVRPCRIIVLKARRLGISTVTEAVLFLNSLRPNTNSCVVAHERGPAETLFQMTKFMYESFPFKRAFRTKYSSKRSITFADIGSEIWVETPQPEAGRSRTIHYLHASELAFWETPLETMTSLRQTVPDLPGTVIVWESTANGIGNFFEEEWHKAVAGETDYVPLFFPWIHEKELIPCKGFSCLDGSCEVCLEEVADLGRLDEDERLLKRLGCDDAHLAWRRWAIPNKCFGSIDLFHQEYPATPEEAFIVSGVNAFPEAHLKACFEQLTPGIGRLVRDDKKLGAVKWIPDRGGPLRIYRMPSADKEWGDYFVGADPCHGTVDGDYAAAQVINRRNNEQVAVWHGKINPIAFADELARLGAFYNQAMISPDVFGPGYATIARLVDIYPRIWQHRHYDRYPGKQVSNSVLGWSSNRQRKQQIVIKLAEQFEKATIILHDPQTYKELRGYTFYGTKGFGEVFGPASSEMHDDLVMALAIAVQCSSDEPDPRPYETRPSPREGIIMGERIDLTEEWGNG